MRQPFLAAAIQLTSGDDIDANIAQIAPLVAEAAKAGAMLVALPENAFFMRREGTVVTADMAMAQHAGIQWAQQAARQHGVALLVGSIRAREEGCALPFNRSVYIAPNGQLAATYDKLHLFDVTLPNGDSYKESSQAQAGTQAVLVRTPVGSLGLSICYDLRFPGLYRALAQAGAEMLAVPSAFTRPTGQAHWHVLLRARAIENGCYVIAPAQAGTHPGGRETYGHTLVVDPWGEIIAEATGDGPQVVLATIDPARVMAARANIPVLQHQREIGDITVIEVPA
jgi:predicted amidohydrolase